MTCQDTSYRNLCHMHRSQAEKYGPRTAMRYKQFGSFVDLNWRDYRRMADRAAAGFISLGIQRGDRVAILSENRFEWFVADHAMLSAGAATMPMHAPLAPKQVAYQLSHSGSRGIIVSNEAQAEKVWEVIDELPDLEFVIHFDPISPGPIPTISWQALMQRGARQIDQVLHREQPLNEKDLATIIYTSGTTGNPKGVMLTHGNLLTNAIATLDTVWLGEADTLMSWLPYSHIYARTVDHYLTSLGGITVALSTLDDLLTDLKTIRPTWITAVPRFYEKVWAAVETKTLEQRKADLPKMFGGRLKQASSGGAPLPQHVCRGFHEAGVLLLEGYGLTESSPVISFNRNDRFKIGTVGQAIPGVEIKIDEDGEILSRGPHIMQGYWKNEQATAETITPDGWLRTGDVGVIDDEGFLSITDRKKDLIVTSQGKNVAPAEIERLLLSDPYIDQAVVYGDNRPFVSALLVPNFAELKKAADRMGCEIESEDGFITTPQLHSLFASNIAELMEAVSRPERVKRFLLLDAPFSVANDELTATLKVRRRHIIAKYADQLAALYDQPATSGAGA